MFASLFLIKNNQLLEKMKDYKKTIFSIFLGFYGHGGWNDDADLCFKIWKPWCDFYFIEHDANHDHSYSLDCHQKLCGTPSGHRSWTDLLWSWDNLFGLISAFFNIDDF